MICFQLRVMPSQKISTRSFGRAISSAACTDSVSLLGSSIASSGTPNSISAACISFGTSSGARPRGLSSPWQR